MLARGLAISNHKMLRHASVMQQPSANPASWWLSEVFGFASIADTRNGREGLVGGNLDHDFLSASSRRPERLDTTPLRGHRSWIAYVISNRPKRPLGRNFTIEGPSLRCRLSHRSEASVVDSKPTLAARSGSKAVIRGRPLVAATGSSTDPSDLASDLVPDASKRAVVVRLDDDEG